ncbi:MAG TPA: APC family permease, partial [Anaerolineae bacterium]
MGTETTNPKSTQGDEEREPTQSDLPAPDDLHIDLTSRQVRYGRRPGDIYVRRERLNQNLFRSAGPGHFVAMPESNRPAHIFEKGYRAIKRVLIGRPLETAEEIHQRLNKLRALAVFGSDAISSSAYATEAALVILIAAGNGALGVSLYTALAIALMLSMVAFSYRQTVYAYPHGGGSYNVSRENLGVIPGLVAASALLIDYVLTVAVSIVAGSAAVTSALVATGFEAQVTAFEASLPAYLNLNVILSLFFIALITVGNLRGIRESGTIFAVPTYLFIGSLSVLLIVGLFKALTGTLEPATAPVFVPATES